MKNFTKLFGLIALVAVIGLSMTGCPNPATTGTMGGSSGNHGVPAGYGSLTITGLGDYNGKYIEGTGPYTDGQYTDAAASMTSSGQLIPERISSGTATLKVWMYELVGLNVKYSGFSKTGTFEFILRIYSSPDALFSSESKIFNVLFTNGVATVKWEDGI